MKIGILIPSTSNKRNWTTFKETYLIEHTLKTFLITYDQEHEYTFYIGIDRGDKIYDDDNIQKQILRFVSIMKNIELTFIYMDNIPKGHLTIMWNRLFDQAYDDNCEYFFQCGDDIEFHTHGWINSCINALKANDDIGLTGPINNNMRILTQSFVSRKHKILFGYYFPPEIINWFCDDWINQIYILINSFFPLSKHFCNNIGGDPRYEIHNIENFQLNIQENVLQLRQLCENIVKRDYSNILHKIKSNEKVKTLQAS